MALSAKQQKLLRECFLFEQLDDAVVVDFLRKISAVDFAASEVIYSAASFQKSVGILMQGVIVVRGERDVILNTLGAGDCFGAAALFQPEARFVTTVQAKTAAQVAFIPDEQLKALFFAHPQTALNYITFLSRRIVFLNRKIQAFTTPTAVAGLALYLLENVRDGVVPVDCGYAGLARRLGIGRASLYRSLDELEKVGAIRRAERRVLLLDFAALQSAASPERGRE